MLKDFGKRIGMREDDIKPEEFKTTYVEIINRTFKQVLMVLDLRNKFLDRFSLKSYFKS